MSAYGLGSRFGMIDDVLGVAPVVIDRDAAIGKGASAKKVIENALDKKTNAYKNEHIVYLNPEYWYL
ncbi:hypothetical protein [Scopulibacillus darangshiensis]|uniref:hypothetical protein n=1 Tax=Scopulibacillus darangshiensis TaxID=442528 RepID=UPI001A9DFDCA|nr:hypothetical protein [Scopulibacillus darangshiensis]